MGKRDRDLSKLETMVLERKFVNQTEADNGYLAILAIIYMVIEVRDWIIKESEVGLMPEKTETAVLLDEASESQNLATR